MSDLMHSDFSHISIKEYIYICCSVLETSVCSRTYTFKHSVLETSLSFYVCSYNMYVMGNKFTLREKRQGIVNSNK